MQKVTKARIGLFLILLAVSFGPLLFVGSGSAMIIPAILIFWLAALAQAVGVPVATNGVDAFNLLPPTVVGGILIAAGLTVSLAVQYWVAGVVATAFSRSR